MPYKIVKDHESCPSSKPWGVVNKETGDLKGCSETKEKAKDHMAALYVHENDRTFMDTVRLYIHSVLDLFTADDDDVERKVTKVDSWDGAASNYADTDAYCAACLIDVNAAAGNKEKKQDHCMLPVKPAGSSSIADKGAHAAAVRFNQVKRPSDVPEEAWNAAVKSAANQLIGAYNQLDETAPDVLYESAGKEPPKKKEKRALDFADIFDQIRGNRNEEHAWAWLQTLYLDDDNSLFAVYSEEGRLYRVPFSVENGSVSLGDWEPVIVQFEKAKVPKDDKNEDTPSAIGMGTRVFRDKDGKARWLSVSAVAMLNRVGEIDSTDLFDSFIKSAHETGEYPFRTFMHLGERCKTGQADFLARDGFVYITSGLYDETNEIAQLEIRALSGESASEWGESIGYSATAAPEFVEVADGVKVLVFRQGINTEISLCPQDMAASYFTAPTVQEVNRMNPATLEALIRLCGGDEEKAKQLAAQIDGTNELVGDGTRIARIVADTEAAPAESAPAETPDPEQSAPIAPVEEPQATPVVEIDVNDAMIARIAELVAQQLQAGAQATTELFAGLTTRLEAMSKATNAHMDALTTRVAALEVGTEERIAELAADLPPQRIRASYRPSKDEQAQEPDQNAQVAKVLEGIPGHEMWPTQ